jgi:hypothetical protein
MPEIISRGDARQAGLTHYFTGRECSKGHVAERFVSSGSCVTCGVERQRQLREDPEFRARDAERRQDPEYRAKVAERDRQRWQDPEYRAREAERMQDPEVRAKRAEKKRQRYHADPEFRAKAAEYVRQKYQEDPNFRLAKTLRRRVHNALKNGFKSARTMELIGCSIAVLRDHLEHQFKPGMSWENFGPVWHIDHCRPCASFDLTDPEQQRECYNFMNMQPMFGAENISKGAKTETEAEEVARYEWYWRAP